MNRKHFIILSFFVVFLIFFSVFFSFFKGKVFAACCDTPWTGWKPSGGSCCYSSKQADDWVSCCSKQDAINTGCTSVIPCGQCENCGNGSIDSGEDCESDSDCAEGETCDGNCQCGSGGGCTDPSCNPPACEVPPLSSVATKYLLEDVYSCSNCRGTNKRDCYEDPSKQPSTSIQIHPESVPTSLGFVSDTHTGAGKLTVKKDDSVNEPIRMVAKYTDTTSAEIEALYIWLRKSEESPITPQYIDLDGSSSGQTKQTKSNKQFGFLMHKEGNQWKPYIPGIVGAGNTSGDRWLKTGYNDNTFYIFGPGGNRMVKVKVNSITASGSSIILDFSLSFNNLVSAVEDGQYNIFLKGNDTFGFTPYDNYNKYPNIKAVIQDLYGPEQIRLYSDWNLSNKNWSIDLTKPVVTSAVVNIKEDSKTRLLFNWSIDENLSLKYVVINLYYISGFKNLEPVRVINFTGGESIIPSIPFSYTPTEEGTGVVGMISGGYLNVIDNAYKNGSILVDAGDNGQGIFDFRVTAFDRGGNVSQNQYLFDFRDWIITQGGLLSAKSIDTTVREFTSEPTNWSTKSLLNRVNYLYSDLSTELVGIKKVGNLTAPVKSTTTKSYMIRPYLPKDLNSYYVTLKDLFEKRKNYISGIIDLGNKSVLNGKLTSNGITENQIAYLSSESLTVNNNFECDAYGIFFVSGDLNIKGKILNNNINKNACIFIVQGNVTIEEGLKSSSTVTKVMAYDEVNAYILANGTITIAKEKDSNVYDGLYINGGIHSLESDGVVINRTLKLEDRFKYPALVIDMNSKYGVLSRTLFGGPMNMQKTEVGVKPF